jgi:voltage-gated potassium channel
MLESIAFLAIVTAWVTSSFVRRAQTERAPAGQDARPPATDDPRAGTDALLRTIDARLSRIERTLDEVTNRQPPP